MSDQGGRVADSELPDLMDPEVQQCPYGLYQTLRNYAPLHRMPSTGFHLVTSYTLAREIIRAPDQYLSGVSPMALSDDGMQLGAYGAEGDPKYSFKPEDYPPPTPWRS